MTRTRLLAAAAFLATVVSGPVRRAGRRGAPRPRGAVLAVVTALLAVAGALVPTTAYAAGGTATLTVNAWSVDTAAGKVTYDLAVSAEGQCTSGCGVTVDLGRTDANGVVQRVGGLAVTYTSQSTANGTWTATATSAGDRVVLTETTSVRAVYTDPSGSYPGAWQTVSAPYPAPGTTTQVTTWTVDTATGKVTYDVTGTAATLAKAGGPCESSWCTMKVETGRLDAAGQVVVVGTLSCTGGGSVHNAWTITVRCTATAVTLPEITRIRPVVSGTSTLAGAWQVVSDPYPGAAVTLPSVTWTPDTATGKVTYDVTGRGTTLAKAGGPCESSWCTMKVETGRLDAAGQVVVVGTLSCTGGGSVHNAWTITVRCVGTGVTLPEITRLRPVVSGLTTLAGTWQVVSPAYPDPTATLPSVTWTPDTATGQVTYDVTGTAATLAKAGGPCEGAYCTMKIETGRLSASGQVTVVGTLSCTGGGSTFGPWTMTVRCTATGTTLPEITRLRPVVTGRTTLAGAWHVVTDPYPDAAVTLPSVTWTPDTATGKVTYDVTGRATSLAKAGGPCENSWCTMKVEAGRLNASGQVVVVATLSCTGGGSVHNAWTITVRCVGTGVTMPEITRIRAVVSGLHSVASPWYDVSPAYPDPSVSLTGVTWGVDTETGQVTYDVTGTAIGLAKAGGPCESSWCTMKVEAARYGATGQLAVVATLSCTGGGSVHNAWTITVRCAGTGVTMPEITRIRPVVTGLTTLTGSWHAVSDPYPDPLVTLGPVTWTPDTASGQVTYDVTGTAVTLAKAGGPCESSWCTMKVEAARVLAGELVVVGTLTCTGGGSVHNAWKIVVRCATSQTLPEVTRIRAVVTGLTTVASEWLIVSPPYPDPTASLAVNQWDFTGDTGTGGAYFDIDIRGVASGLARAGGPCETTWCSMSFEGGLPDVQGVIRTRSRLAAEGGSSIPPGTWRATISSAYDHALVPDQLYMRVAVYQNGYLVLATPWQERSSIAVASGGGGFEAAFLAGATPLLLERSSLQDPCIETLHSQTAPHTNPSSLNDYQYTCETARAAGYSRVQQFAEVAKKYGKPAVILGAAAAADLLGVSNPTGQDPITALEDDPVFLRSIDRLLRRQSYRTTAVEPDRRKTAIAVQKKCRSLGLHAGDDNCDTVAVWIPGLEVPTIAGHARDAIADGKPWLLSYASEAERTATGLSRGWYNSWGTADTNPCKSPTRPAGTDCDEYPYFSTSTSGPGASLRPLPSGENRSEGGYRRNFWSTCGISSAPPGSPARVFIVMPMPEELPTMGFCAT